ncbi:leucyl aminopeptidase [Subtercola frigoramans]|uniref:Probable cytosol aminopeptidase n=1 Tax=Subtercola frigoramans TaxID=120298 RepID=A0ABS2L2Y0_9MICO|nr:leucyl aminopeptidase [Subtercola frigoramans]MBM7471433.1 leucyl aminopeptidase [Subtercola frigoramans]
MALGTYKLIASDFSPIPSQAPGATPGIRVVGEVSAGLEAIGFLVGTSGDVPDEIGLDREALERSGFDGKAGASLALPQLQGPQFIVVGAGDPDGQTPASLRDAAAAFARAAHKYAQIGIHLGDTFDLDPAVVGQMISEGVLLARYRYVTLKTETKHVPLVSLDIMVAPIVADEVLSGVHRGEVFARAACIARDLANTPPSHLTATDFGEVAGELGAEYGIGVELFDKQQIIEMGCGGLLGVNAGSIEEPRIIKLTYTAKPTDGGEVADAAAGAPRTPHLAFVGKGIMYDSGGISLKPSDPMHFLMKMDMAGAAAVLGAMTALETLGCPAAVTAFLMCTDNMPSGSAMKLGDVLTIRGGKTVEVKNTDAEGRLVMSDALVLATEESPDAIVDIATLTGAAVAALGTHTAAVLGNDQALVDQALASSRATDESVWQLPLEHRYLSQLKSEVADLSNLGGKYAGATTAALFLNEFVGDTAWAHLDIAGTMMAEADDSWRTQGATGFGTRLLIDFALNFAPTRAASE